MRRFFLWLYKTFPWLLAKYRLHVSTKRKCPACGVIREHKIQWDPIELQVMHTCALCEAKYGQTPIEDVGKWLKKPQPARED
jgi:hypothetical protein